MSGRCAVALEYILKGIRLAILRVYDKAMFAFSVLLNSGEK